MYSIDIDLVHIVHIARVLRYCTFCQYRTILLDIAHKIAQVWFADGCPIYFVGSCQWAWAGPAIREIEMK